MNYKTIFAAIIAANAVQAGATTVTFNELTTPGLQTYASLDSGGLHFTNSNGSSGALLVWGTSDVSFNADPGRATLSNNYGGTTTTVTKVGGGTFSLGSIDLADVYNNAFGGDVLFSFTTGTGTTTQVVSLDNLVGLQTFVFNIGGLTSFSYLPQTTQGPWIQVDNVVFDTFVTGAVPEPESWAMMIAGLGLVGAVMRRRAVSIAA